MKRTETTIIRDILYICWKEPARKTRIVYQANLNFNIANNYIAKMLDMKAIEQEDNRFKITPNGISLYHQLNALPGALGGGAGVGENGRFEAQKA